MLARDQTDALVALASAPVHSHASELDQRVAPPHRVKCQTHELLEPRLLKIGIRLVIHLPLGVAELKRPGHDKTPALIYAAGEVRVNQCVPVDII